MLVSSRQDTGDEFSLTQRCNVSNALSFSLLFFQEPIKSRAPQLHLEYRFYKQLGSSGKKLSSHCNAHSICVYLYTYILYTSLRLTLCLFGSPPWILWRPCLTTLSPTDDTLQHWLWDGSALPHWGPGLWSGGQSRQVLTEAETELGLVLDHQRG